MIYYGFLNGKDVVSKIGSIIFFEAIDRNKMLLIQLIKKQI